MVKVVPESSILTENYDSLVLVLSSIKKLTNDLKPLASPLKAYLDIDNSKSCACIPVSLPFKRLIYSPTGPLNRDYDDVRRISDASETGIKRALKAGSKRPLLVLAADSDFEHAKLASLIGALHALYVPIEIREDVPEKATKAAQLGFYGDQATTQLATAIESARAVARDIGGSDPERMSAPRVEAYVKDIFSKSDLKLEVVSDSTELRKSYPLFAAVDRASAPRHKGRVIFLTYQGSGETEKTLMLVGKGVTYDTGGADVKAGGVMAGMHRDKCGAAAVAGFMKLLDALKPPNVKVIGALCMVRNSIGSECYVSDEIITSRAGVRVRVGNTDAEGRMAMADVLCHMKEKAQHEVNPHLMTVATLTGHCVLACGEGYSAVVPNGPARLAGIDKLLGISGEAIGDPFELSSLRREDYEFHDGPSEYENVLQCNNLPSSRTPRGHQTPAAFLILASGLDKYGKDSSRPLKYVHIDIAGSSGPFPGVPSGAPILALSKAFLPKLF